jgi:large subunit ribosomal protein L4
MKLDVKNLEGKKVDSIDLPESIYGVEMNEHVLHTVVKAYRANRRQGTHATKTRSLVSGTGKKPFRQKGTGSARQGSSRAPHMYHGAVVHGPQPRDYTQQINKKVKQLALKVALSDKVRNNKLVVVKDFTLEKYSTKSVVAALNALTSGVNALVSDERKDDLLHKSTRNIYGASCVLPTAMNAENILRHDTLVLSETALKAIAQRFEGEA